MELLAAGTRINLVLSNVLLPLVDGVKLLLHVKQHYPRIPFAYVTAVNDAPLREQLIRYGADGYLLKPFLTEQELLAFVRRTIGRPPRR